MLLHTDKRMLVHVYKGCPLCTGETFAPSIFRHKSAKIFRYTEKQRAKQSRGNAHSYILTKSECFILKGNQTTKMNARSAQIWEKNITF